MADYLTSEQLEEHLLAYYRVWQVNLNEFVSKANSEIQYAIIDAQIRDPACSDNIPPHVSPDFHSRNVTAGLLPEMPPISSVPPSIIMRKQLPLSFETFTGSDQSKQQPSAQPDTSMHTGHK